MLEEHRSQPFLLLSMLIILVQKNASAGLWHINLLIWLYPTLPAITSTLPHDPLAVFEWVIKKTPPMYVDTKANSHTESVETHTFFPIHLPTIKTVLYADLRMVSLQNPSEQHKFM